MTTRTSSQTFTRTEARYLASKVVADLYQCSRLYGRPASETIPDYETELVEHLVNGHVSEYEFGFRRDEKRIVSWRYEVKNGDLVGGSDDRPGRIYARADTDGASHYNFLTYSWKWSALSTDEQEAFESTLPFSRNEGSLPSDGNGYWIADKTYARGGVAITRRTFRPL